MMLDGAPKEVFRHYKELEAVDLQHRQVTYLMPELKEKGLNVDIRCNHGGGGKSLSARGADRN